MRASRILQHRQERGFYALAQLCEERDDTQTKLNAAHNTLFVPPRLSFPPQTPYSVGSNAFRPNGTLARDRLSPPRLGLEEAGPSNATEQVLPRSPPEHMAPKRTKYTSPPPPEAPDKELVSFESRLDEGLSRATAATDAREEEKAYMSSSSNSELLSEDSDIASDVAQEDDAKSVQSFTGDSGNFARMNQMRPLLIPTAVPHRMSGTQLLLAYQQAKVRALDDHTPTPLSYIQGPRGRKAARQAGEGPSAPPVSFHGLGNEGLRRSNSNPARPGFPNRLNFGSTVSVQVPQSPVTQSLAPSPTVYYETNAPGHRHANAGAGSYSPSPVASPVNPLTLYQQQYYLAHAHAQAQAQAHGQSHFVSDASPVLESVEAYSPHLLGEPSQALRSTLTRPLHAHTHSSSTIVGPPTPAASTFTLNQLQAPTHSYSRQSSPSQSPSPTHSTFRRSADFSPLNVSPSNPSPRYVPSSGLRASVRLDLSLDSSPEPPYNRERQQTSQSQSPSSPHLSSAAKHMSRRQHEFQSPSEVLPPNQPSPEDETPAETRDRGQSKGGSVRELKLNFDEDHPQASHSPLDSPPSSNSSQGDSASGYAPSPGSLSPVSSVSPRTTDLGFPCAPTTGTSSQVMPINRRKPSLDAVSNQLLQRENKEMASHGHGEKDSQTNLQRFVTSLKEHEEVTAALESGPALQEQQRKEMMGTQPPRMSPPVSPLTGRIQDSDLPPLGASSPRAVEETRS